MTGEIKDKQDQGKHRKTPESAFPKSFAEGLTGRETVIVERAVFHAGNDPGGEDNEEGHDGFGGQFASHGEDGAVTAETVQQREDTDARKKKADSDEDEKALPIGAAPADWRWRGCGVLAICGAGWSARVLQFPAGVGIGFVGQKFGSW